MFCTAAIATLTLTLGIFSWDAQAAATESLLSNQYDRLKNRYSDQRVFRTCVGRFGGLSDRDAVVGVLSRGVAHRLALIWDGAEWELHDIDAELKQDAGRSRSLPMRWNYSVLGDPAEDFRCDLKLGQDHRIGVEGDKPLFERDRFGVKDNTAVCFETDDTYNNWDCAVYSPKDKRFRLWFQQAHAD